MKVAQARELLRDEEAQRMIDAEAVREKAIARVEQSGIVFIDEIDKIARRESASGPDVSREGVQRDLLPIVEGTSVQTKHGRVRTDHVLFIAAGAFHVSRPSDLIPELQGRFPIRVELEESRRGGVCADPRGAAQCAGEAVPGVARDRGRAARVQAGRRARDRAHRRRR